MLENFRDLAGERARSGVTQVDDIGALFVARDIERVYDIGDSR